MRLKPPHTQLLLLRKLLPLAGGLLSLGTSAQTALPINTLPSGGQVSAGQASISQSGANMLIQQGSNRAAINWQSFNVGSSAQVQFQQPNASSVTLNRVMSADPSQIFGRITANGQVILTNPQGVYFGKDARVDVGGIIATTHGISDADFLAGKNRFERNGSTASVVNEGELKAGLGGYIALLAPEVRNQGAIIAQMGTVALAAGEAVDLHFDSNNRLTSIRVEPSQIQALVDNRHAVQAPGGLIVLSAQSMDRLVGGVVRNSGRIEANGLQQQGGRIVLSASHKVENTGNISANASVGMAAGDSGPAGKIEISAPEVVNSGSISANGAGQYAAGTVRIEGGRVEQTASGSVRAEAAALGGRIEISASENAHLEGVLSVAASVSSAETTATELGTGGIIDIEAAQITLSDVVLDASGLGGGTIRLHASGGDAAPAAPEQPSDPRVPGRLAILGNGAISVRGRSARGGLATLTGDDISLLDNTSIDATGATGGGKVLVGGDWQGSNDVYQATTVLMKSGATIDASATDNGDGGTVVLWSDIRSPHSVTTASGVIYAKGGVNGGDGGKIETSGGLLVTEGVTGSAAAPLGRAGEWLFDPTNVTIGTSGVAASQNNGTSISASSIASLLNGGTSVTVTTYSGGGDLGDLTVNSAISKSSGAEVTLTLRAANSIVINQSISHSGGERLNLLIDADNDTAASTAGASPARNGGGIVILEASLSTGGGGVTFGGTVNGVYTGGDLFVGGSNAVAISTAGGAVDVKGNLIIANSSTEGFTINTAGGAIDLRQAVDSGNQYTMVSGSRSWEQAFTDAKDNGGWLATIGSSLENALAIRAAGYSSAWLGGQRIIGTNEWRWTADPNYNASTNPMTFFYQGAATEQTLGGTSLGAGGKTAAGYFANWSGWTDGQIGSSEPNNWNGSAPAPFSEDRESALQFTGSQGLWNDLSRTNTSLDRYVLETNLAPSRLNLNAGVGAVNIGAGVGFSKPLATLNVTSSSSNVNGNGLVTTGAQTYSSALTVNAPNSTQDVRLSAGDSGITAAGRISIYGASIAPESSLNSTASGAGLLLQATGNIDSGPSDISFTTNNGAVSVLADSDANGSGQIWLGKVTVNPGSGNVILRGEIIDPEFATINGTGTVTLESSDVSFGSAFNTNRVNLASTLTGLTVGKSTNTQDVTVGAALSIAGPISIYGGNIALNAALTANGDNTITLQGSGNVTQTAALSAYDLVLSGTVSLDQANTISNSTTLQTGTLGIYVNTALGSGSLTLGDNTNLLLGRAVTQIANNISLLGAATLGLDSTVDFLLVGGAGGGGTDGGGGGGGGGLYALSTSVGAVSSSAVTVGTGGTGGIYSPYVYSTGGGDSSMTIGGTSYIAGGGAGGGNGPSGAAGGAGGTGTSSGGRGGQAANGGPAVGTNGSNGSTSTITGSTVYYGGGGGGGIYSLSGQQTSGGLGGGGAGATWASSNSSSGYAGAVNTGGGGGGGSAGTNNSERTPGGAGGSGIVMVRYKGNAAGTGGTVSAGTGSSTGYTLQTFTSSGTLTLNAMAPTLTGVISGSGGLTVNATDGAVTLTGTNSYAGTTTLSGGTVKVGNATTTGALGVGAITNNAALVFNRSNALTVANPISGTGTLTQQGSGTLTLTGSNSYSGTTTINSSSTLQIGGGDTSGTLGTGAVTDNGTLVFNRSDDVTVANAISGTGALTKVANNTLTLSANGTYTGVTTVSTGTLVLQNNAPTKSTSGFSGPGALRIESLADDFSSAFSTSGWTFDSTLGGLTLGKASSADGTSDKVVTIPAAISIAGPISIYGGNIALNAALTANGENTITLKGSGSITQTAALSATNLLLLGGNVTLTNASNAVETLAASGVSSLSYIDSNALTLGTVDTTNGISASGAVSIGTQSLGLTVAQNLTTTDATSSALTLNADIDTVAGTSTGGNIIVSGSPTISVGSGGIAKLYTGSVSGSTGLTALVGSGSGRFRYNSDEAAANYTSALVSGLYSIYREQPAATVTVNASTMTYGDTLPVLGSATSLVNGDTASFEITGRTNASSGNINYKSSAYAVTNTNLAALGYNVTVATPGTLTVNQKSLTLSGLTASDKTYDTNTIATLTGTAAVTALGSDVVTLGGTALGTFADKSAADGKAVTVTGVTLSGTGADNGNYILLQQTGLTASIGKANLSVTGLTASDKTYDTNTIATLTGTAAATALSSDVVTLGGTAAGTFADKDVGTAKAVIVTGVTLSGTGADNGNYILLQQTGLSANISAKTVTLSASKTYDGTTNLTGFVNLGGLVGSETLTYSGATSNDAHVATGSKFISAMTLANAVDGSGGLASNYQLPTLDVAYAPVTINAKALTSTASIGGTLTKTFSGTTAATGASVSGTVNGAVSGDTLTLNTSALALNYNTAHVVGSSTIAASGTAGFTIDASSANSVTSDYSFTGPTIANVSGTINAKALTATASIGGTLSKVYDGVSDAPGAGLSGTVSGAVDGDMLTLNTAPVSLAYNTAHVVGGNKIAASGSAGFTIAGSTAGSLSSDYSFTAPSIADVTASITAKAITLTAPTTTKVYDGQTTYVASAADLAALSAALGVSGDSVSGISLTYDDKNVGTSKTLAASHAAIADGNSGGNYTISYTNNTQSSISRRSSVTWVGGASGNWFDPANWAAGAVPDLSNVANVVIPSGVTVSFGGTVVSPAQGGAVNLDGLTGAGGNLSHSDGTLNVGNGGITLGSLTQSGGALTNTGSSTLVSYTQSGGSYTGAGPMTAAGFVQTGGTTSLSDALTVTQDFSQGSLGNVTVGGNTRLTDTNGGAQLGNLNSTGVLTVNSTDGAITQAPATVITTQSISSFLAAQGGSTADIALSNMGNDFHAAVGLNGRNVAINDTNALALGIASTTGNLTLTSNGALNLGTSTVGGNASANSGNGDITQSGAFRVGGATTLLAGTGAVNLFDPGNLLAQGVTVVASSSNIVGDSRKSAGTAEEKVQGSLPATSLPGLGVPTAAAPAPLVLTQNVANAATADSAGSGNQASAGGTNNAGITIDLREAPISSASIMAAVSLPKGTATAGTGFSFELPESIRDLMGNGQSAQLSLSDGRDLPAWLRFNAQTLSFEAAAVPNGAFPLQLALSIGGQRVMVVISERVE